MKTQIEKIASYATPTGITLLLAAPDCSATALKKEISRMLTAAINGSEPRYRMDGYIRWGLVEKEIWKAIDDSFAKSPNARTQRQQPGCADNGTETL